MNACNCCLAREGAVRHDLSYSGFFTIELCDYCYEATLASGRCDKSCIDWAEKDMYEIRSSLAVVSLLSTTNPETLSNTLITSYGSDGVGIKCYYQDYWKIKRIVSEYERISKLSSEGME